MKAVPAGWDGVCKAFTQLGADPDPDLGAASQAKSLHENSQLLVCVRSARALLPSCRFSAQGMFPLFLPGEGAEFSLCAAEEISGWSHNISTLPRTLMVSRSWLQTSVQLWSRVYCAGELPLPAKQRLVMITRTAEPPGLFLGGSRSSISVGLSVNSNVTASTKRFAVGGSMFLVEYCEPGSSQRNGFKGLIYFLFDHATD